MKPWTAGTLAATSTQRRRLLGAVGSRRGQLMIAVLFGSLIGGGFVAASTGSDGAERGAPAHAILEQFRAGHTNGSGYDQDQDQR